MTNEFIIYHNPRCSKSRAGLAYLKDRGIEPKIIRYLDNPPTVAELKALLNKLGLAPRELLRSREPAYKELGLKDPNLPDEALIEAMASHPKLIERPIVVRGDRAVLARPAEKIEELLD